MEVWIVAILCVLIPGYYGFLARNGLSSSDMIWSTMISIVLCLGIFFVLHPRQMGPVIGAGFIGLALAVFSTFMNPKSGDSEESKAAKTNIKSAVQILGAAVVVIVALVNKFYL